VALEENKNAGVQKTNPRIVSELAREKEQGLEGGEHALRGGWWGTLGLFFRRVLPGVWICSRASLLEKSRNERDPL
jgi:hypothetical protein